jgi:hypothetical protein
MRSSVPPPSSLARNYSQRPKQEFSPDARQLLFNFPASTQCELREEAQDGASRTSESQAHERPRGKTLIEVFTGFDPESGS